MVEPSKRELEHALRYATEKTKLFLMDVYKKTHSHIFHYATMKTRPATTSRDYYVPPSIAHECIVVTETKFEEGGCLRAACFPVKENLEPCEEWDVPHWIPFGKHYTLACQPACREKASIDTYWKNGTCFKLNPLKKMLALFPEKLFENPTKHPLHYGLEWHDDHLSLNSEYCLAYGLLFDGNECVPAAGQSITEIIFGKTIVRSFIIPNQNQVTRPPPPDLPAYVHHKKRRVRRHLAAQQQLVMEEEGEETSNVAAQVAKDLSFDFGIDIGVWLVKRILVKKVPQLITQATSNVILKSVLAQAVMKTYANLAIQATKLLGSTVGLVSQVFTVYSLVSVILDVIDPYTLNQVLDSATLKKIDLKLDLQYYKTEKGNHQEVTPEYMWDNVLNTGDESERYIYLQDKMIEYIHALRSQPETIDLKALQDTRRQEQAAWHGNIQVMIIATLVAVTMLWWKWVHVWATLLFFMLIWFPE